MAEWGSWICHRCILIFCLFLACESSDSEPDKPCTYFGGSRVPTPESSLVNCSWYASNACCKRTEVTSVFGGMKEYPLSGASKECRNQINYLMCYFCSPEQYRWYNKKAYVCAEYCNSVFDSCRNAQFNGKELGSAYNDGKAFCNGQKFEVAEGNGNCFKFDPTVFAGAPSIPLSTFSLISAISMSLFIYSHS